MPIQKNRTVVEGETSLEKFQRFFRQGERKYYTLEEVEADLREVIPDFDRMVEAALAELRKEHGSDSPS